MGKNILQSSILFCCDHFPLMPSNHPTRPASLFPRAGRQKEEEDGGDNGQGRGWWGRTIEDGMER